MEALKERIQVVKLSKIKPYKKNVRKHDNEQINILIERFKKVGYLNPIIVDVNFEIISGHARYIALKRIGAEKVLIVYADNLSPEEVRAQRIADNRLSEMGEWDISNLRKEIGELLDEYDLSTIGFNQLDLSELFQGQDDINFLDEYLDSGHEISSKISEGMSEYCDFAFSLPIVYEKEIMNALELAKSKDATTPSLAFLKIIKSYLKENEK